MTRNSTHPVRTLPIPELTAKLGISGAELSALYEHEQSPTEDGEALLKRLEQQWNALYGEVPTDAA